LTTGAREAAFRNIKTVAECLADELVNAAKGSSNRCDPQRTVTSIQIDRYQERETLDDLILHSFFLCSYAIKKKDELERVAKANR
jgi:small subunit ribosomal protein S5e